MHNVDAAQQEALAKQKALEKKGTLEKEPSEKLGPTKKAGTDGNGGSIAVTERGPSVRAQHAIGYLIEILGLILAVTAIVYAYVQKKDSQDLKNRTESLLNETKTLESSMTTHYVAPFPASMDTIANKVKGTCSSLDAMVDVPGYGHYSDPELFDKYQKAITETALLNLESRMDSPDCVSKGQDLTADISKPHPKVRVLLFAPEDRVASGSVQYSDFKRGLTEGKDKEKKKKQFLHFFERNPDLLDEDPKQFLERVTAGPGFGQFRKILLTRHCVHERELRTSSIQIRYSKQQFITRLWIIDKLEAVFSFDHKSVEEIAFRSSDRNLLKNFNGIFESWWQDSVPYSTYWNLRRNNPGLNLADMPKGGGKDDPIGSVADNSCETALPAFLASGN